MKKTHFLLAFALATTSFSARPIPLMESCSVYGVYEVRPLHIPYDCYILQGDDIKERYELDDTKILYPHSLTAGTYSINVKRTASEWYEIQYKDLYLKTSGCYKYTYGNDAILKWYGTYGKLIFED